MATPPPQAATRVASGRLIFGKPDGKVKSGRLLHVKSFDSGGGSGAYGRRVSVEAVNGAVRPNGAAVADVRQVPAPPPASMEDDGDAFRLGKFVEGRLVYRQQFVIRSYEIGPDRTATMETLMNLLQVRKMHSVRILATHLSQCMKIAHIRVYFSCAMFRRLPSKSITCAGDSTEPCDVLWACWRRFRCDTADEPQEAHMGRHKNQHPGRQVQQMVITTAMHTYIKETLILVIISHVCLPGSGFHMFLWPDRGDVVEIDTWVASSGKNGMRRDWIIRDRNTKNMIARATRYISLSQL